MEEWEGTVRFGELQGELGGEKTRETARQPGDEGRWTRKRSMPLEDILRCILSKKGLTTTMELWQYFQVAESMEQRVSKQDYLRQRQHLNPAVFKLLHENYLGHFYRGKEPKKWRGYVVLAVDGSRVEIPDSEENRQKYGASGNQHGKAVARANLSTAYDVYNRFIVDIGIPPYTSNEIEEAREHLPEIKKIIGEQKEQNEGERV